MIDSDNLCMYFYVPFWLVRRRPLFYWVEGEGPFRRLTAGPAYIPVSCRVSIGTFVPRAARLVSSKMIDSVLA